MNLSKPMSSKLNKVYNNAEEAIKGLDVFFLFTLVWKKFCGQFYNQ